MAARSSDKGVEAPAPPTPATPATPATPGSRGVASPWLTSDGKASRLSPAPLHPDAGLAEWAVDAAARLVLGSWEALLRTAARWMHRTGDNNVVRILLDTLLVYAMLKVMALQIVFILVGGLRAPAPVSDLVGRWANGDITNAMEPFCAAFVVFTMFGNMKNLMRYEAAAVADQVRPVKPPAWLRAVVQKRGQMARVSFLVLALCTYAFDVVHWRNGPAKQWPGWQKSWLAYASITARPLLWIGWVQWAYLLLRGRRHSIWSDAWSGEGAHKPHRRVARVVVGLAFAVIMTLALVRLASEALLATDFLLHNAATYMAALSTVVNTAAMSRAVVHAPPADPQSTAGIGAGTEPAGVNANATVVGNSAAAVRAAVMAFAVAFAVEAEPVWAVFVALAHWVSVHLRWSFMQAALIPFVGLFLAMSSRQDDSSAQEEQLRRDSLVALTSTGLAPEELAAALAGASQGIDSSDDDYDSDSHDSHGDGDGDGGAGAERRGSGGDSKSADAGSAAGLVGYPPPLSPLPPPVLPTSSSPLRRRSSSAVSVPDVSEVAEKVREREHQEWHSTAMMLRLCAAWMLLAWFVSQVSDPRVGLDFAVDLLQVAMALVVVAFFTMAGVAGLVAQPPLQGLSPAQVIAWICVPPFVAGIVAISVAATTRIGGAATELSVFLYVLHFLMQASSNTAEEGDTGADARDPGWFRRTFRVLVPVLLFVVVVLLALWAGGRMQSRAKFYPTGINYKIERRDGDAAELSCGARLVVSMEHVHAVTLNLEMHPRYAPLVARAVGMADIADDLQAEYDASEQSLFDATIVRRFDCDGGVDGLVGTDMHVDGAADDMRFTDDNDQCEANPYGQCERERVDYSSRSGHRCVGDYRPRYAMCGQKWHGFSLSDYALMSQLAYFDPVVQREELDMLLQLLFPVESEPKSSGALSGLFGAGAATPEGSFFELRTPPAETMDVVPAFVLYSAAHNVSIVVIRGTDVFRLMDLLEDARLFAEPVLLELLNVFPTRQTWSDRFTGMVVGTVFQDLLDLMGLGHRSTDSYYSPLVDYIDTIDDDHHLVITGHSLGGGLAHIIGGFTNHASVAFSPPGVVEIRRKLWHGRTRLHQRDLHHRSVAVIPQLDPVAQIGVQAGMLQHIMCNHPKGVLGCHMIERTACELLTSCGDPRGRFAGCDVTYSTTTEMAGVLLTSMLPSLYRVWEQYGWIVTLGVLVYVGNRIAAGVDRLIARYIVDAV